jgi:hypothetical protein
MHGTRVAPTLLLAAVLSHACASKPPTSYDIGMVHVFVNGEHTGALPGRAVYGPGKSD